MCLSLELHGSAATDCAKYSLHLHVSTMGSVAKLSSTDVPTAPIPIPAPINPTVAVFKKARRPKDSSVTLMRSAVGTSQAHAVVHCKNIGRVSVARVAKQPLECGSIMI